MPIPRILTLFAAISLLPGCSPDSDGRQGISGTVWVQALVSKQGRVVDTRLAWSVSPLLDEAATDAVRQWEFKPAMDNGHPVAVWVIVPVKFRLP